MLNLSNFSRQKKEEYEKVQADYKELEINYTNLKNSNDNQP